MQIFSFCSSRFVAEIWRFLFLTISVSGNFVGFSSIVSLIFEEFEALLSKLDPFIKVGSKENFHEYLRSVTNIISNNVYQDKDNTFKLLNRLRKNENIVVISADTESCMVILNKTD